MIQVSGHDGFFYGVWTSCWTWGPPQCSCGSLRICRGDRGLELKSPSWLHPAIFSPPSAFITSCQGWHLPKALLSDVVLDNLHWRPYLVFITGVFVCCGDTAALFGFYGTTQPSHLLKGIDLVWALWRPGLFEYLLLLLWFEAFLSVCVVNVDIRCYHRVPFDSCWCSFWVVWFCLAVFIQLYMDLKEMADVYANVFHHPFCRRPAAETVT